MKYPVSKPEKTMKSDLRGFIEITECLQYMRRQGQAVVGDTD